MTHMVTATFSDPGAAERAVGELVNEHFNSEEISVVVSDRAGRHAEKMEFHTGIAGELKTAVPIGGIAGALVATGIVLTGGAGLLAAGPLLAALQGAVAGSAIGYGFGALAGLDSWAEEVHVHADHLEKGGIVVGVPADHEHAEHARQVFAANGAEAVQG